MLLHHPHGSFTDFRGKLVCLVHGFIFSGVEASAKPGAVQIDDADKALAILNEIRSTGVRLALDDFGTGYSSLSYLRRFPFDTLKIDRSFVTELLTKDDAKSIVKMITDLAKELGKHTVCEGVETVEQLDLICTAGCHQIQGNLIAEPCPLNEFSRTINPDRVLPRFHGRL
ncbi:EAL domain-containing protein [Pseudomonas neustonica]|uniref:EAL domain-containing protein n=1 Tax=Pseudomonas neustonica TaxID=2487346 RepID=A0ABX9XG63_9PSED|nr:MULTISPECIES: EAL domain-containing protein [Pseudomonas]ROZ80308.1 EAL domain-containing protein [Pseudomonas sp. SSM44]ROZ81353.1 EAL domain-containing protein [Pseudomonas neustonica]